MSTISTYNFVPAPTEDQVYKVKWSNKVSHDIPFSDGESGEIEIKLTAKTPIFIRNGQTKSAEDNEFSNFIDRNGNKTYFIPGTSLKGMIRNVLEILSFSRLNKNLVNNDRYSYRDLSDAKNLYLSNFKNFDIKAGWLYENSQGNWVIEECEDFAYIHHEELEIKGIPFRKLFLFKNPEDKTAKYKYDKLSENKLQYKFSTETKKLFGNVTRNIAVFDDKGKSGTLVFTGQSSKRQEHKGGNNTGKVHEFVFFNSESPNLLDVTPEMQKDFRFIYYNDDKNNISKDWKYWRDYYLDKEKKVPVFYSKNDDGELMHFGLTYMYKLPYKYNIHEMSPFNNYSKNEKDLATTIFGYTDKEDSLKGRVMIGHAICLNSITSIGKRKEILGTPKASFFPYYLSQDIREDRINRYKTYDEISTLRGYKRYPVHSAESIGVDPNDNEKVYSTFCPLQSGSEFLFKIRFHNLRKIEIGSLIAAITFNGNKNCYHSIGGAKPYGYGKVSLEISNIKNLKFSSEEYLNAFREEMVSSNKLWSNSDQLKELFSMASNEDDKNLKYPPLTDFVAIKRNKDFLLNFSEYSIPTGIQKNPTKEPEVEDARVVSTIPSIQVRLADGDKGPYKLEVPQSLQNKKPKKIGDKIKVRIKYNKGGNIEKVEFISKY